MDVRKGENQEAESGWEQDEVGKGRKTYIHIGSKDHNRPRIEFLRNNNLGIFSTLIFPNPNFRCLNFDQLGGDSFEGRGRFFELRDVGLEGCSEEV